MDLPGARVVLEVTLEGSAQKLVTVRSALQVKNQLQDPIELRLENTLLQGSGKLHIFIEIMYFHC